MERTHTVVDSPIGPLTVVAEGDAVCGLYMEAAAHVPPAERWGRRTDTPAGVLAAAGEQLGEYFAGERRCFDLPLAPAGTPFQTRVWEALREIPYGRTESYGQVAARVGRPGAARAVGLANGRNPIAVIVPCHRVIGAGGGLTGYGGGLERKRLLLDLERAASELRLQV